MIIEDDPITMMASSTCIDVDEDCANLSFCSNEATHFVDQDETLASSNTCLDQSEQHAIKMTFSLTLLSHCSEKMLGTKFDPVRRNVLPPGQTVLAPPRSFYGLWWRSIVLAAVAHNREARVTCARERGAALRRQLGAVMGCAAA